MPLVQRRRMEELVINEDSRIQRGLAAADDARTEWRNVLDESPGTQEDRLELARAIHDVNIAIVRVQSLMPIQYKVPDA